MYCLNLSYLLILFAVFKLGWGIQLKIECDDPIVLGATLNCTTKVYEDDGKTLATGAFQYTWMDDAIPQNSRLVKGSNNDTWSITYDRSKNNTVGGYVIRVDVCRLIIKFLCFPTNSIGIFFRITENLHGQLVVEQGNNSRDTFVSTAQVLENRIALKPADKDYMSRAPTVLSYWFVDCVYYGITSDMQFKFNFDKPEENHVLEALVVGDFTPLPPSTTVAPTTTSTSPTTTTKGTSTTTAHTTSTTMTTTVKAKSLAKRAATDNTTIGNSNTTKSNIKIWNNGTLVPYNNDFPFVCNNTAVATDSKKVYGYFKKTVTTKAPVSNITVSGNNWLQHGELLTLNVNCKGSTQMQFCYFFKPGLYNVTGNETCEEYSNLEKCNFPIQRYFLDQHTVVIIIKNDISKEVTSVAVTVYKVKHQAQLSVIVVPVAFSLVAVVTIVFGVAYYLQNRSRFIVEVADFDFGQKYADMEYKNFKDRLKDSIVNAFTRDPMPSTSDAPIWPPGHKYGSMT